MSKNNARTYGGNRKGPGYRTASSFRAKISVNRRNLPKDFNKK